MYQQFLKNIAFLPVVFARQYITPSVMGQRAEAGGLTRYSGRARHGLAPPSPYRCTFGNLGQQMLGYLVQLQTQGFSA